MEKHQKFSIWYVLLGIWLVLIAQQYLGAFFSIEVIPYSQFLRLLKENKISEVAISANQIQGKMKLEGEGGGKEKMFRSTQRPELFYWQPPTGPKYSIRPFSDPADSIVRSWLIVRIRLGGSKS